MMGDDRATIEVSQETIEKALVAHLFGDMMAQPDTRDKLLQDFIAEILNSKERDHDKDSILQKVVKEQIAKQAQALAEEWLNTEASQAIIRQQVSEYLSNGAISKFMTEIFERMANSMSRRGY